jgi:Uma2 family endonuclease
MGSSRVHTRYWTRAEYDRLIDLGLLDEDEPVELLGGRLVVREPQQSPHATSTQLVAEALRQAFGRGYHVRCQLPIALDEESEPEPDVSVVSGDPRDYRDHHPARAVLVVEVSARSLAVDRRVKGSLYARAGIEDYWIVNVAARSLEVNRRPGEDRSVPYGWRYRDVRALGEGEGIAPLAAPGMPVAVASLLA